MLAANGSSGQLPPRAASRIRHPIRPQGASPQQGIGGRVGGSRGGIQRSIVGYVESWIPALGRNFMRKRVASGRDQPLEGDPILGPEESARKAIKKPDGMPLVLVRVVSRLHLAPASDTTKIRPGNGGGEVISKGVQ